MKNLWICEHGMSFPEPCCGNSTRVLTERDLPHDGRLSALEAEREADAEAFRAIIRECGDPHSRSFRKNRLANARDIARKRLAARVGRRQESSHPKSTVYAEWTHG